MALVGRGTCLCVLQHRRDHVLRGDRLGAIRTDELCSLGNGSRHSRLTRCGWDLQDQIAENNHAVALSARHRTSPARDESGMVDVHRPCSILLAYR